MSYSFFNIGRRSGGAHRRLPGRFLALVGLLAGTVAAQTEPAVSTPEPQFEGPRIRIVEMEKEFGTVTRGELLEATYRVENIGSEPLRILRVKPG